MKKFLYLITLFLIVGLWLGINFARNQPLFSNPFADEEISKKAAEKVERVGKGAKDAVGRAIDDVISD